VLAGLSPSDRVVLLSSHLISTSQNDEIIEPIVHRLLSYFMLICEVLPSQSHQVSSVEFVRQSNVNSLLRAPVPNLETA
jgi:hypothetical protein